MAKTLTGLRHFVQNPTTRISIFGPALLLSALFFALGLMFVPLAGIQNDEAIFTTPIYQNVFEFRIRAFHHNFPLMLMSYLGTLKTVFVPANPSFFSPPAPTLCACPWFWPER